MSAPIALPSPLFALLGLLIAPPALAGEGAQDAPEEAAEELPPLIKEPGLVEFVQAPYPVEAKAAGIEGTVGLAIEISETGAVSDVQVIQPAGNGFDVAAVEAAWKMRFTPAEDTTGPVPVIIEFAYGFVLDADEEAGQHAGATQEAAQDLPADLAPVNLEGTLVEMGTRTPMARVAVQVTGPAGFTAETTTDRDGRWTFRGVPVGPVTLTAVHPGYDTARASVDVVAGEATEVRLWIRNQSYRDNEIIGVYRKKSEDVTRRTLTVEEVHRVPGTFGDPVRVIQNLPGAARSPFGTGLLVIRGANPEDSAVYVDGIRIPLIYHLGGYVSVINSDMVEAVDYLPGGYGVEYGRSTGGVVDVRTQTTYPDNKRFVWSTDALDSGGLFEGKVGKQGKTGLAIAGRHSYIEYLVPYFVDNPDLVIKPRWYDYQIKVDRLDDTKDDLGFFLFGFQDTLIASSGAGFAQGTDQDTQGDLGTTYSTHRAYVRWEHDLAPAWKVRAIPSIGFDYGEFLLGNDWRIYEWQSMAEIRGELEWAPAPALSMVTGIDFIGGYWKFGADLPINPDSLADFDPIGEREPWSVGGDGDLYAPDIYLDVRWRPLPDTDRLLVNPGVRFNYVAANDYDKHGPLMLPIASLDPRLAVRWGATESGTLKTGLGLYHQPPQPFEAWRPEGAVDLGFERAWSAEVGWEQRVGPAIEGDVAVFYKWLDGLIVENDDFGRLGSAFFLNDGRGRAYGTEIILRHALVDRFFGWVSYTLSRSDRIDHFEGAPTAADLWAAASHDGEPWYPFDLDQTHILVGVAGYRLPRDWEVSGKVQYVTGNPYTPYSGGVYDLDQDYYFGYSTGNRNSERLPQFIAVDARVDRLFTFKRWQLEVYLDLLNVIRGVNPEFQVYNYDYTESTYIRGLPFIPSPGFQAELKF